MATFLDTGILGIFSALFSFVLVFVVVWGILLARAPFGNDKKGLYSLIALMVAFLVVISPPARAFLEFISPWFVTFAIALFMIFIVFSVFGKVDGDKVIRDPSVHTWIIIVCALILVAGLAFVFGQGLLNFQGGDGAPVGDIQVMDGNGSYVPGQVVYSSNGMPLPGREGVVTSGSFQTNMVNTIVHPKVLGIGVIFLLSALIIYFLSKPAGGI